MIGGVGGVLGVIYSTFDQPRYESKLTFSLDEGENGLSGALNLAAKIGLNIGGTEDVFSSDNILPIIKSRHIIETVLLSIDTFESKPYSLAEYYWEKEGGKTQNDTISFPVGTLPTNLSSNQRTELYNIYLKFATSKVIAARPDRRIGIYEVSVISTNERFCKIFTERLITATNNFYINICTKKAKETMNVLEEQAAAMKSNLNKSIGDRARIQDVNLNSTFSAAQVPILKQQANIQVYGAAYGEMYKNIELSKYEYLKKVPLMQIIDPADYPMKKVNLGKLATGFWFAYLGDFLLLLLLLSSQVIRHISNLK